MKHFSAALLAVLVMPLSSFATTTWEIDSSHTTVGFKVKHLMISNVQGRFKDVKGTIEWNDKDPDKSTVEVDIQAASVDTNEAKRDGHLKSPDFFDVQTYPKITFKSTSIETTGGKTTVKGNLTMHGVTKPVILNVESVSAEAKDPWGSVRRAATATGRINRKDFGLNWQKKLDSGGVVVGDDVSLMLEIEATKKIEAPSKK